MENSQHVHGFPECRNIKSITEEVDVPCPKCGGKVIIKKTKTRRKFFVCENNTNSDDSKCDYISWSKPVMGEALDENKVKTKKKSSSKKATKSKKASASTKKKK